MGEQPLQDMELQEQESQKGRVYARNVQFGLLDNNMQISELWSWGFGDLIWRPPMEFGTKPRKIFGYLTLTRLLNQFKTSVVT